MRDRLLFLIAALLSIVPSSMAQTPQAQQSQAPVAAMPFRGSADFGGMFTTTDGDQARYERYRDARDGVFSNFTANRQGSSYLFDASASHIGYRDQKYAANYLGSKLTVGFDWVSLPLNFSYLTRTAYTTNGTTLTLNNAARAAVQGPTNATNDGTAVGVPCAPGAPPASCSTTAQAAQAKATPSIYSALANPFDLRHQRDTASVGLTYAVSKAVDLDAGFLSSKRDGQQPWGASFAFNNAVEVPLPIDQRTNDVRLGASWSNDKSMFRVGWDGSWFNNAFQSLVWDNPIRITDFNNGINTYTCPATGTGGPWDCSGYSNGNGSAQGREALAPDNHMNVVSATGLYRLPRRTTLNGTVQFTSQNQNDSLIPWTINSVIDTPATFVNFPQLAALPRSTAHPRFQLFRTASGCRALSVRGRDAVLRSRHNRPT